MAVPTLGPEEYQLDDDGVLLNGDVALPFVDILNVQGLDNAELRTQIAAREGTDGSWVDSLYETERSVILEAQIYADTMNLESYLDSLKANWAPSRVDKPLYIGTDAGDVRVVFGKPQGMRYDKSSLRRLGCVEAQFTIICGNPLVFASEETSASIPGTIILEGNRLAPPVIRINGSRTDPSLTLGGKTLTIAETITGGHYVDIDVRNRKVYYDGVTNWRSKLQFAAGSVWDDFMLSPGGNTFTVGGTGTGTITVTARSAWR